MLSEGLKKIQDLKINKLIQIDLHQFKKNGNLLKLDLSENRIGSIDICVSKSWQT